MKLKQRKYTKKSKGNWIQTYTGKHFYPLNPKSEDICIEDIAHSLSQICRYNGHTNQFYSVAKHSILLSYLAEDYGIDSEGQLYYLMHDAHEAYVGDMTMPMKYNLRILGLYKVYNKIVKKIDKVIFKKFNIKVEYDLSLDSRIVLNEKIIYMGFPNIDDKEEKLKNKKLFFNKRCLDLVEKIYVNENIKNIFIERFNYLTNQIKSNEIFFENFSKVKNLNENI